MTVLDERAGTIAAANDATRRILEASFANPATVIKAPPGAGKSTTCSSVVALHVSYGHRVAVATPTRAQGQDLAQTIAARFPSVQVVWFGKDGPDGVRVIENKDDLPAGEHVAIGTVARWGYYGLNDYDLLVVDEAWQVTDAAFGKIAGIAERIVLMGDPGQIAPVVTVNVAQWAADIDSPVAPAPNALRHRHPSIPVIELPATWRFGADSARIVSAGFYDWAWGSNRAPGHLDAAHHAATAQIDATTEIVGAELPALHGAPRADRDLAQHIATMVQTTRDTARIHTPDGDRPVQDIFVVAAHIDQVAAARAAIAHIHGVTVDTAERLQGRQADVVFAWHPASGMVAATDFQRDAGRLCVMLSRHKYGVVLVYRRGTLELPVTASGRTLAAAEDPIRRSMRAQRARQSALYGRVTRVG